MKECLVTETGCRLKIKKFLVNEEYNNRKGAIFNWWRADSINSFVINTQTLARALRFRRHTNRVLSEREREREGAKLLAHDELPLKVLLPLTSASWLFPAICTFVSAPV